MLILNMCNWNQSYGPAATASISRRETIGPLGSLFVIVLLSFWGKYEGLLKRNTRQIEIKGFSRVNRLNGASNILDMVVNKWDYFYFSTIYFPCFSQSHLKFPFSSVHIENKYPLKTDWIGKC